MATRYERFDRKTLKNLRVEMQALLEKYGVSANVDFKIGNMRFTENEVEIKVNAKINGAKTLSNVILETRVAALGVKMENKLGDRLVDYKTRSYKYPFVYVSGADGKRYKASTESVRMRFAA